MNWSIQAQGIGQETRDYENHDYFDVLKNLISVPSGTRRVEMKLQLRKHNWSGPRNIAKFSSTLLHQNTYTFVESLRPFIIFCNKEYKSLVVSDSINLILE